jgi:hypothetical protein
MANKCSSIEHSSIAAKAYYAIDALTKIVVARKNRKSFGKHVNSRLRTDKGGVQTHFYMISPKFLE